MQLSDICWLAGLLEGEGCFLSTANKTPGIQLLMTDRDVVERAAALLGGRVGPPEIRGGNRKPRYSTRIYGNLAASWMMTLYAQLGTRRRAAVRKALTKWRSYIAHERDREFCKNGHPLVGDNVLPARWTDSTGKVHRTGRRCRECYRIYLKNWRQRHRDRLNRQTREMRRAGKWLGKKSA
jgi:hypothetical protein